MRASGWWAKVHEMGLKNLGSPPLVSGRRTAPAAPSFFLSFPPPLVKNRHFLGWSWVADLRAFVTATSAATGVEVNCIRWRHSPAEDRWTAELPDRQMARDGMLLHQLSVGGLPHLETRTQGP